MKIYSKLPLLALLLPAFALAEYHPPVPYGVSVTIDFPIYASDGTLSTSETDDGNDVQVYCGAGDSPANSTNDFADDGDTYTVVLTAAEMQCAYVKLQIDGATDDNVIIIPTYGHASAMIEGYSLLDDAITSGKIAASAIGASELAADAIGASELASDAGTELATASWAHVIEDQGSTYDAGCALAAILAVNAGERSGGTHQDPSGTENRVVGTASGSTRNAITITCP